MSADPTRVGDELASTIERLKRVRPVNRQLIQQERFAARRADAERTEAAWRDAVPKHFQGARLAHLGRLGPEHTQAIKAYARAASSGDCGVLLLTGGVGVGKTYAAAAVARHAHEAGCQVRWESTVLLLAALQEDFGGSQLRALTRVSVLVLDDIATRADPTSWVVERLWAILDERMNHHRALVLTTNVPMVAHDGVTLGTVLGSRIWDRLRGEATILRLDGSSLRGADATR